MKSSLLSKFSHDNVPKWETLEPVKKEKVKKTKSVVVNSVFEKFHEVATDLFWKDIFENAMRGKFPKNFSFSNSHLIYRNKKNYHSLQILEEDYTQWQVVCDFFKKFGFLSSEEDQKLKEVRETNLLKKKEHLDYKKKKEKDIMITNYINKVKADLQLSPEEVKDLESKISFGYSNKYITVANVKIEDGDIVDITNVHFSPDTRLFRVEIKESKAKRKTAVSTGSKDKDSKDKDLPKKSKSSSGSTTSSKTKGKKTPIEPDSLDQPAGLSPVKSESKDMKEKTQDLSDLSSNSLSFSAKDTIGKSKCELSEDQYLYERSNFFSHGCINFEDLCKQNLCKIFTPEKMKRKTNLYQTFTIQSYTSTIQQD